jgi:hypothetical protein
MSVSCVCCVGSGLCVGLITRLEESYRVCVCVCIIVYDLETSTMRRSRSELGCCDTKRDGSAEISDGKLDVKKIIAGSYLR